MTAPAPTPVFNCVVNVAPAGADGLVLARVANLAGIEARGRTEREALAQVVASFKSTVAQLHNSNQPIPFLLDPLKPSSQESQRLIAVHL
jgi:hypothetical protein